MIKIFYYTTSSSTPPGIVAAWLEGFLKGSGTLLLLDTDLWTIINNWVIQLEEETFKQVLPLLRRTFSNFSQSERRKLGEKAKGGATTTIIKTETDFDEERAKKGIAVVMQLFGYKK